MGDHGPQGWVGDWSGKRARLTPDRVGLVDATTGREFTYAELDRRATRCAAMLDEYGVTGRPGDVDTGGPPHSAPAVEGPGEYENAPDSGGSSDGSVRESRTGGRVAVVSRNRPEVVDLFFATGKTGGVLAPLSHRLATPELAELLAIVDPALVVVEEPFSDDVASAFDHEAFDADDGSPPVLSLPVDGEHTWEAYNDALDHAVEEYEGPTVAPADTHLFLHTGGSTGTPKETVISHEAVVWNSLNTITAWGLRDDDVTPMVFPTFHTGGWNVITLPLFHMGGEVVIAREFEPGQILDGHEPSLRLDFCRDGLGDFALVHRVRAL